jgi:hypothetical protein
MNDMNVRWGATLPLTLTVDEAASTATLTVSYNDVVVVTKTASFTGLSANLTLSATQTQLTPKKYQYMIKITYADGTIEKYPDTDGCTDCELPTLEVCDTNDNVGVS